MRRTDLFTPTLLAFVAVVAVKVAATALVPVLRDEAYYYQWSHSLALGYYDHPPGVALIGLTTLLAPGSIFVSRLGTLLVGLLTFPFTVALVRRAGLTERAAYTGALLATTFNLFALGLTIFTTPDALLLLAWVAALAEAAAAIDGRPARWLGTGVAVGVGLLAKYSMALIVPVLVWGVVRGRPEALRTPWPYAGALIALLILTPHLTWNAQNDWVPARMQFGHGLGRGPEVSAVGDPDLPRAEPAPPGGPEGALLERLELPDVAGARAPGTRNAAEAEVGQAAEAPAGQAARLSYLVGRLLEYAGGLALWWGALVAALVWIGVGRLRRRRVARQARGKAATTRATSSTVTPRLAPLLRAAVWVPIVVFAAATVVARGEANWPAPYVVAAGVLLGPSLGRPLRATVALAGINALAVVGIALHARAAVLPLGRDRLLRETRGYEELAARVERLSGPVLFDRYQLGSMLLFYRPALEVAQLPGASRPSEFTRNPDRNPFDVGALSRGGFWLATHQPVPPRVRGFTPVDLTRLTYCVGGEMVEASVGSPGAEACPDGWIRRWYLVRYLPLAGGESGDPDRELESW